MKVTDQCCVETTAAKLFGISLMRAMFWTECCLLCLAVLEKTV